MASGLGGASTPVRVATLHNSIEDVHPVARPLLSYSFRVQTHCLAASPVLKIDLLHLGVAQDRVSVLPNGVSLAKCDPREVAAQLAALRISPDAPVVVFPIRFLGKPGQAVDIVKAVQRAAPDAVVVVAGIAVNQDVEDRLREGLLGESVAFPGSPVVFTGFVKDLRTIFAASSVVAAPSPPRSLPLTLLEAMSEGAAVVSGDKGEIGDLIMDGVTGRLLIGPSAEDVAGVIGGLLTNGKERERLGAAGRERVASEYSDRASVKRLEALYDELIQQTFGGEARASV